MGAITRAWYRAAQQHHPGNGVLQIDSAVPACPPLGAFGFAEFLSSLPKWPKAVKSLAGAVRPMRSVVPGSWRGLDSNSSESGLTARLSGLCSLQYPPSGALA